MNLAQFKSHLAQLNDVDFFLPNGNTIPGHYHITEVGKIKKEFIDCGGKLRNEEVINFQLWFSDDDQHRLTADKISHIVSIAEKHFDLGNLEIEVEYQTDTIGKFGLDFQDGNFLLTSKATACLANEVCGVPQKDNKMVELAISGDNSCAPGGGCC